MHYACTSNVCIRDTTYWIFFNDLHLNLLKFSLHDGNTTKISIQLKWQMIVFTWHIVAYIVFYYPLSPLCSLRWAPQTTDPRVWTPSAQTLWPTFPSDVSTRERSRACRRCVRMSRSSSLSSWRRLRKLTLTKVCTHTHFHTQTGINVDI